MGLWYQYKSGAQTVGIFNGGFERDLQHWTTHQDNWYIMYMLNTSWIHLQSSKLDFFTFKTFGSIIVFLFGRALARDQGGPDLFVSGLVYAIDGSKITWDTPEMSLWYLIFYNIVGFISLDASDLPFTTRGPFSHTRVMHFSLHLHGTNKGTMIGRGPTLRTRPDFFIT